MIVRLRNGHADGSCGFALLVVLWFLVLIAAIGTYVIANARSETAIARNVRAAARAEALADAAIAQTVFNLTDPSTSNRWKLDGSSHRLLLPGGEVTIRLDDESQKINPNRASDALLAALFESTGVERFRARELGVAISKWVAPDADLGRAGAKTEEYRNAGKSYGPPSAPVESLDELQLVLGMTPEILASVRPYLTIHTKTDRPDGKNASLVVRQALNVAARAANSREPPPEIGSATSAAGKLAESIVEIEVTALDADGGTFIRHAILRIEPNDEKGYVVLAWRRGDLVE